MAKRKSETIEQYNARCAARMREWRKARPLEQKEREKAAARRWAKINAEKWKGMLGYKKKSLLKTKYGISLEKYHELLEACGHKCVICRRPFTKQNRDPHIDHCHKTGMIRGLLCTHCNTAEGKLRTPEIALR